MGTQWDGNGDVNGGVNGMSSRMGPFWCHASDGNTFYQAVVNREPEPVDENADNVIGVTTLPGGTKLIHVEPPTRRA